MGAILTSTCSHILLDKAVLIPEGREIASHWASQYMTNNPAYRWVVGKYVEADRPNSNMQQWRLADLAESQDTIKHAPLNVLHEHEHIVGNFVGSEMMFPNAPKEGAQEVNPFIEAVAAFYRYYFPAELSVVEKSHAEGSLFFSMECVGESITFIDAAGANETFEYAGARSDAYGDWGKDPNNIRQINKPHFLAGALIFPPARPGWKGASVKELSKLVDELQDDAELAYETFAQRAPYLDPGTWEELMLEVMVLANSKRF